MNFRLSATRHTRLVVPDCMQVPQAAVDRYGPLEYLGEFDERALGASETARLMAGIDAASFAVVPEEIADRLLRAIAGEGEHAPADAGA
jgi:hypothetical protein